MNIHGQIVGYGSFEYVYENSVHVVFNQQAFLMNPVPEPSTILLLSIGSIGILAAMRKHEM